MSNANDIRLVEVQCAIQEIAYRTPIKFGGRVAESAVLLDVSVEAHAVPPRRLLSAQTPPGPSVRSNTTTWWPSSLSSFAATIPAIPAPITATRLLVAGGRSSIPLLASKRRLTRPPPKPRTRTDP